MPRESLLFIIPAFGGTVSWEGEGAPFNEVDEAITHQVDFVHHNYYTKLNYSSDLDILMYRL